jgi:UDP-glucose 4-epimerase
LLDKTTLITGGAGFIGSHLAECLKARGHRLLLVDNLATGSRHNVEHLLDERCRLVETTAGEAVEDASLMSGVGEVYHLAAAVGVKLVVEDPAGMIRNNVDETLRVLEAAVRHDAAVLITSSSEVYGKCPTLPLREDMDLVYGPTTASRWSYGLTKAIDEHLAIDYARRRRLRAVIVRLFNTIGPRQVGRYGMVVPRFVARAVANQPLDIYGDGSQTRAFCDVRDVARALADLLACPDAPGRVFNVGSEREITINELADRVIALTGSTGGKRRTPYEAVYGEGFEDPPHRLPDISRLRKAIGFEPRHSLDQTLTDVIATLREDDDGRLAAVTTSTTSP